MPDIEFTETRDGLPAITIPLRSPRLGIDGAMLVDWLDTVLWALGNLREGRWDTAHGPQAVRDIGAAINALDHRLAPRLDGLRAALIRLHKQAGGSVGDLASAMDVGRSTAQGRQDRTLAAPVSSWENWARSGGPQPPVPVRKAEWTPDLPEQDRLFSVGDPVRLVSRRRWSWIDEDLEQEGEDARVRVTLEAGTRGRVTVVRPYPTPYPYTVLFDGDQEVNVRETDIERSGSRWADRVKPAQDGPGSPEPERPHREPMPDLTPPPFVVMNDQGTPRTYGPPAPSSTPEAPAADTPEDTP